MSLVCPPVRPSCRALSLPTSGECGSVCGGERSSPTYVETKQGKESAAEEREDWQPRKEAFSPFFFLFNFSHQITVDLRMRTYVVLIPSSLPVTPFPCPIMHKTDPLNPLPHPVCLFVLFSLTLVSGLSLPFRVSFRGAVMNPQRRQLFGSALSSLVAGLLA